MIILAYQNSLKDTLMSNFALKFTKSTILKGIKILNMKSKMEVFWLYSCLNKRLFEKSLYKNNQRSGNIWP